MKKLIFIFFAIPFLGFSQLSPGLSEVYFDTTPTAGSNKGVTSEGLRISFDLKSDLSSPTFTGDPKAPTPSAGDNDTSIATTAFVLANARPYKVYVASLYQSGTSAPVDTVMENTLGGTLVWTRTSIGVYVGTLSGAFSVNKTAFFITFNGSPTLVMGRGMYLTNNTVGIDTSSTSGYIDAAMTPMFLEIRVYP